MLRGDWRVAGKLLRVILGAHEWSDGEGWRLALLILSYIGNDERCASEHDARRRRTRYLQQLDLASSAPFKAQHTTSHLVHEYISANRLSDAIELLEQRVNIHPYKSQPELHTLLGMLYLYVAITTLLTLSDQPNAGVQLKKLDRSTKNKARQCFETALQSSANWMRSEIAKRQRIWGMRWKDEVQDGERVRRRRRAVWGTDPLEDEAWPTEEHQDLKTIRKQLESGQEHVCDQVGSEQEGSAASGTLHSGWSDDVRSTDERDAQEEDGSDVAHEFLQEAPDPTAGQNSQHKGAKAWIAAWPWVSAFYTPEPPLACKLAEQFLQLLGAPTCSQIPGAGSQPATNHTAKASRRSKEKRDAARDDEEQLDDDTQSEASSIPMLGGIQLTREEAELRLRRILFEDADEPRSEMSTPGASSGARAGAGGKKERKRERVIAGAKDERRSKKKRNTHLGRDRAGSSSRRRSRDDGYF